jgi:hypothetical protein
MRRYELVSGLFLSLLSLVQLVRFVRGWPVLVAGVEIPVWTSAIAFLIAGSLALWGLRSARATMGASDRVS